MGGDVWGGVGAFQGALSVTEKNRTLLRPEGQCIAMQCFHDKGKRNLITDTRYQMLDCSMLNGDLILSVKA